MTPAPKADKITAAIRAMDLIGRWRPYMKVFGQNKGFPKNSGSMLDDITAEIKQAESAAFRAGEDSMRERAAREVMKESGYPDDFPSVLAGRIRSLRAEGGRP